MAYSVVKRGAVLVGTETSFGAGASELGYVRVEEATMGLGREYQTGSDMKQDDSRDPGTWLATSGEVSLKGGLHPQRNTWPTAKPTEGDQCPMVNVIEGCMGEAKAGGYGVTATTGNTATKLKFPALVGETPAPTPTEMGFKAGEFVFVRNANAPNILGAQVIKEVSDAGYEVILRGPLPGVPGASAIAYGGYSIPKQAMASLPSYEIVIKGSAAFDKRRALGCTMKGLKINAPATKTPTFEASYFAAKIVPPTVAEDGGAPGVQDYDFPEPAQVLFGGLYAYDGVTNTKLDGSFAIDLGVKNSVVQGVNDVDPNGVAGNILTARDVTTDLTPSYESNVWYALMDAPANTMITGWFGRGAQVFAFQLPAGELMATPDDGAEDDHKTVGLKFGDAAYTGDVGTFSGTDAGNKSCVLGFLG